MRRRFATDPDGPGLPFWKQRSWQVSAVFFAVLLAIGGYVMVRGDSRPKPETAAVTGPLSQGAALVDGRPIGCRTDDEQQATPVRPPGDVTWLRLNGAMVPLSASAGPTRNDSSLMWCFAHTPMGAVMAAHVVPRELSGPDWRAVVEQQVIPGPGREIFIAMRSSLRDVPSGYSANSITGFQLVFYSGQAATVRLLVQVAGAGQGATDYRVQWSGGDWKIVPSSSGDLYTPLSQVSTSAGFVMWEA